MLYSDLNQFSPHIEGRPALWEDSTAIKQAIFNILNTTKGERLFHPTFGTNLNAILMRPILQETEVLIFREVSEAVALWEPRATLNNQLTVITAKPTENKYDVKFVFDLRGLREKQLVYSGELFDASREAA